MRCQLESNYRLLQQLQLDCLIRSKQQWKENLVSVTMSQCIMCCVLTGQWLVKLSSWTWTAHNCDDSSKPRCCKLQTRAGATTAWRHNKETVLVAFKNKPRPQPGVIANWLLYVDGTCRIFGKRIMATFTGNGKRNMKIEIWLMFFFDCFYHSERLLWLVELSQYHHLIWDHSNHYEWKNCHSQVLV